MIKDVGFQFWAILRASSCGVEFQVLLAERSLFVGRIKISFGIERLCSQLVLDLLDRLSEFVSEGRLLSQSARS